MKNNTLATLLGFLMLAGTPVLAQSNVVVVDLQAAIFSSEPAKEAMDALKKDSEYAALQAELETLRSDIQGLQKERETKGMTWSAQQLAENKAEVESLGSDFQYNLKKAQSKEQAVVQEMMEGMQPKVKEALTEIGQEQNIDLILDSKTTYYASDKADITAQLVKKLNEAK